MNPITIKSSFCALCITALWGSVFAQDKNISTDVISVEKNYTPVTADAQRDNIRAGDTPEEQKMQVDYKVSDVRFIQDFKAQPIGALDVPASDKSGKVLSNYIMLAGGTKYSTFADISYGYNFGSNTIGFYANHDSKGKKITSDFSQKAKLAREKAGVYYTHEFNKYSLDLSVDYAMNITSLYDRDLLTNLPENHDINNPYFKQRGGTFYFDASFMANSKLATFKGISVKGDFFNNPDFDIKSHMFEVGTGFNIGIQDVLLSIDFEGIFDATKAEGQYLPEGEKVDENSNLLSVTAKALYKKGRWDVAAGFKVSKLITSEKTEGTTFGIYPQVQVKYGVIDGIMNVYAKADGGMNIHSMNNLMDENPFLSPWQAMIPVITRSPYSISAGIDGAISANTSYDFYVEYSRTKNAISWVGLNLDNINQYVSMPNDTTGIFKVRASVSHDIVGKIRLSGFAEYNAGESKRYSKPLYLPDFRIGAAFQKTFFNHLGVYVSLAYNSSSRAAFIKGTPEIVETAFKDYFSYDAKVEYKFARRWGIFVMANNMIADMNPMFLNYDNFGLRLMAGARFNF